MAGTVLLTVPAQAQRPNRTLQAYVETGLAQNVALRREAIAVASAGQRVRQAGGLYQPQVQLGASYTLANGGRTINIPAGDLVNPAYRALNALTGTSQFPQVANVAEQLLPNNFQETKLRIIQPLFNTDIYFNYKAQKELLSAQQARQAAYRNTLRHQIEVAYYQYLQAGAAVAVYRTTAGTLTELLRVNQARLAAGITTNDAVYNTKAQLAGNQRDLTTAANRRQLARTSFNYLLNRPLDDSIAVEEPAGTTLATAPGATLTTYRTVSLTQRPELEQLARAEAASALGLRQRRAARLYPQLNWVTDLGYQGFGYRFDVPQQRFQFMQFALSWDLFRGGIKRGDEQLARLALDDVQAQRADLINQLQLQVTQAFNNLASAREASTAAAAAQLNAEKSYAIVRRRYVEGQAIVLELLDATTRQTTAQLARTIAGYDVFIREAELRQALAEQ
ncbi:TolC family protein [Hymenobacter sp. IS2118]|uniref:TolC family protein n=1 Tax=Hymenobacter sp. IS2118 TaxID=1505605 RepID=UPI000AB54B7D|nr:TolC family protein [Hymenobacter sp. IS2118]